MKRLIILTALLQLCVMLEANEIYSKEKVDVFGTKENIYNSADYRSEPISADITGHTLTITFNDNVGIAQKRIKMHRFFS